MPDTSGSYLILGPNILSQPLAEGITVKQDGIILLNISFTIESMEQHIVHLQHLHSAQQYHSDHQRLTHQDFAHSNYYTHQAPQPASGLQLLPLEESSAKNSTLRRDLVTEPSKMATATSTTSSYLKNATAAISSTQAIKTPATTLLERQRLPTRQHPACKQMRMRLSVCSRHITTATSSLQQPFLTMTATTSTTTTTSTAAAMRRAYATTSWKQETQHRKEQHETLWKSKSKNEP